MNPRSFALLLGSTLLLAAMAVPAQLFRFTTLAGSVGTNGAGNGLGTAAQFAQPQGVAEDAAGNVFIADTANQLIREITPGGTVTTFAGTAGVAGFTNGTGTNALFNAPQSLAHDSAGNWYVADTGNHVIRKITAAGVVSTFAGSPGVSGSDDGTGTVARFYGPQGVALDSANNVYVADTLNHTVRRITSAGVVTTIAGLPGFPGDGNGTNSLVYTNNGARLNRPAGLAVDASGNIYVADSGNHTIREISPAGTNWVASPVAGLPGVFGSADGTNSNARFGNPLGVTLDAVGNIYVADTGNHTIREISPVGTNWVVSTLAGFPGSPGSADGSGIAAQFLHPAGLVLDAAGRLGVADGGNATVRTGTVITNAALLFLPPPQSLTVNQNSDAVFTAALSGATNVYYQWYYNGAAIAGANGTSYAVANAQPSAAGNYAVEAITATGTAMSSNAVLTVNPQPQFIVEPAPQVCVLGGSATFPVLAMTEPLGYQWWKNGIALTNNARFGGVTTSALTVTGATTNEAAYYSVTISNLVGVVTSSIVTLTVAPVPPRDGVMPVAWWPLNEGFGGSVLDASGNGNYGTLAGVTWTNGGHGSVGANFNGSGAIITVASEVTQTNNWTAAMWVYRRKSGISSALITGGKSNLKLEQWNNTGLVGYTLPGTADYTFSYGAPIGAWTHLAFVKTAAGLTLYTNGVAGPVNTNLIPLDVLTLGRTGNDQLDAILNDVRIYNQSLGAGQISNLFATGIISPPPTNPPAITNPPVNVLCLQGANATFTVGASALSAFYPDSFQWFRNGTALADGGRISGSRSAGLTVASVTTNDTGAFSVIVTNGYGAVTSSVVSLTVVMPPVMDWPAPAAWWLFNEGTGTVALDYSGNGHNCTLSSGFTWTNVMLSGAAVTGLNCNGTSNAIATVASPFTVANDWSAAMWVYRRKSGTSSALLASSSSALKLEQWSNTGLAGYTLYGTGDYTLNFPVPTNTWTHLAFVKTSGRVTLYANGAPVATNLTVVPLGVTTVGRAAGDYLDARLGETRLYNVALTAQQVTNLFAFDRTSFSPAVLGAAGGPAGTFQLTIQGLAGQPYTVLETTNLTLPLAQWTKQSAGLVGTLGQTVLTNLQTTNAALFFQVHSP